jgi:Phosphotransferase enzyme family
MTIEILLFDDDKDQIAEMKDSLELKWKIYSLSLAEPLPNLVVHLETDASKVNQRLQLLKDKIQVFLCDIHVKKKGPADTDILEIRGFDFLRTAEEIGISVRLAVTSGDTTSIEDFEKLRVRGSYDDILFKSDLYESGVATEPSRPRRNSFVGRVIYFLGERGRFATINTVLDFHDIRGKAKAEAVVEIAGLDTIKRFVEFFSPAGTDRCEVSAMKAGYSGAVVLLVRPNGLSRSAVSSQQFVLKISTDKKKIQYEYDTYVERILKERLLGNGSFVRMLDSVTQPKQVGEWMGIASEYVSNATTFGDWLEQGSLKQDDIESLLEDFFFSEGGVSDACVATKQEFQVGPSSIFNSHFTKTRVVKVRASADELLELLPRPPKDLEKLKQRIESFIGSQLIGKLSKEQLEASYSRTCFAHGDLHSQNILIETGKRLPTAKFVDFATITRAAWCSDLARLCVDLFMSSWDSGARSYKWDRFQEWELVLRVFGDKEVDTSTIEPENKSVWFAVRWLSQNLYRIHAIEKTPIVVGEFFLSLACEFLRSTYRKEVLPPPKRAFGLLAAGKFLEKAEIQFEKNLNL